MTKFFIRIISIWLFFVYILTWHQSQADCPIGATKGVLSNKCYRFFGQPLSFVQADSTCLSSGNLTSIINSFENANLAEVAAQLFVNSGYVWTGGNRLTSPPKFSWIDGSLFSYTNWLNGQPSNVSDYDCLALHLPIGKWSALPCTSTLPYICEVPASVTSVTTTVSPACPTKPTYRCESDWHYFNFTNQCYYVGTNANWQSARTLCATLHSNLTSIHSFEESGFVEQISQPVETHVGLNKINSQDWQWIDGTPLDFTNWHTKEPSGDGPCGAVGNGGYYDQWNDVDCNAVLSFVCRKPAI